MTADLLLIGVGNVFRGDDAAGLLVARQVMARGLLNGDVRESDGDGAELMELWRGRRHVLLIDAVKSDAAPGSIHRFPIHESSLPSQFSCCSTHLFGVADAIELSRVLNELPDWFWFYGIEGKHYKEGNRTSDEVASAVERVCSGIEALCANGILEGGCGMRRNFLGAENSGAAARRGL